jgi:hypothetical protein
MAAIKRHYVRADRDGRRGSTQRCARPCSGQGVDHNTLVRKLERELLGAKGVGIKRKLKRGLAKSEEMRATAKRRKNAARQPSKKAHLKKARA